MSNYEYRKTNYSPDRAALSKVVKNVLYADLNNNYYQKAKQGYQEK